MLSLVASCDLPLLDDNGKVMTTDEEWMAKITGHSLRSVIFPPGWKFK